MYHYVRDLENSRYPDIKGLDINLFKEQIDYMRKYYHVIKMEEVIHSIDNQLKIPEKSVLLTFDDAYSDHYSNVFPESWYAIDIIRQNDTSSPFAEDPAVPVGWSKSMVAIVACMLLVVAGGTAWIIFIEYYKTGFRSRITIIL